MGARDYSDVKWPWEGDPNWGAPREGATSDSGDQANWALACDECGLRFPMEPGVTVGTMAAHWNNLHAAERGTAEDGGLELQLVWIGLGTPPQPPEGMVPG